MDPKGVLSDFSTDLLNMELLLLSLLRECSVCGMSLCLQEQHCAVLKLYCFSWKLNFWFDEKSTLTLLAQMQPCLLHACDISLMTNEPEVTATQTPALAL